MTASAFSALALFAVFVGLASCTGEGPDNYGPTAGPPGFTGSPATGGGPQPTSGTGAFDAPIPPGGGPQPAGSGASGTAPPNAGSAGLQPPTGGALDAGSTEGSGTAGSGGMAATGGSAGSQPATGGAFDAGRIDGGGAGGSGGMAATGGGGGMGATGGTGGSGGNDGDNPYPPIDNGCNGHSTRYWDCCKAHCGWEQNVSFGVAPLVSCGRGDDRLVGDYTAESACAGGTAHMCHGMAPWAASSSLSYGYTALAARGDICGRCYQLQFTGSSHNSDDDPGSRALAGKTMIVQATNVGGDVGSGQFDLLIPGGGVGAFNACSSQWGVSTWELGEQYGGFLSRCKQEAGWAADLQAIKNCVAQRCSSVFEARGLSELAAGCRWFVDWFEAADNPSLVYREIPCPPELTNGGMNRNSNDVNSGCGV